MPEKIYRSDTDRIIAGVCGGIAEYFRIDSTIVRLIAVVLAFTQIGILAYIIAIFIIPKRNEKYESTVEVKDGEAQTGENPAGEIPRNIVNERTRTDRRIWLGVGIILIGVILLLKEVFFWIDMKYVWPALLILLGFALLVKGRGR